MRAEHRQGAAVFEGLGTHPSMFCEGRESERREGCPEYATKDWKVSLIHNVRNNLGRVALKCEDAACQHLM